MNVKLCMFQNYYGVYILTKKDGKQEYLDEIIQIEKLSGDKDNIVYINKAREALEQKLREKHIEDSFEMLEIFTDYEKAKSYRIHLDQEEPDEDIGPAKVTRY